MSKQDYERLTIEVFGRQLITSEDLDPVYCALPKAIDNPQQLNRWLLAYFCFYHCGVASYISEFGGANFWNKLMVAARNEKPSPLGGRWPRASERRHARGGKAIAMVKHLEVRYGRHPEDMVGELVDACDHGMPFAAVSRLVKTHFQFGGWISFKVGDILERVLDCDISFENADVFMFKDPAKAAIILWRQKMGLAENAQPKDKGAVIREVVDYLKKEFKDLQAPPLYDRPIGLQEVETILCKFKSHMNGHYPLLNDIDEIRGDLDGWGDTAKAFKHFMPEGTL